ncbi:hypothetical protein ACLOJK_001484 [Asimina triloba]
MAIALPATHPQRKKKKMLLHVTSCLAHENLFFSLSLFSSGGRPSPSPTSAPASFSAAFPSPAFTPATGSNSPPLLFARATLALLPSPCHATFTLPSLPPSLPYSIRPSSIYHLLPSSLVCLLSLSFSLPSSHIRPSPNCIFSSRHRPTLSSPDSGSFLLRLPATVRCCRKCLYPSLVLASLPLSVAAPSK